MRGMGVSHKAFLGERKTQLSSVYAHMETMMFQEGESSAQCPTAGRGSGDLTTVVPSFRDA
jgi:hypothetical protein